MKCVKLSDAHSSTERAVIVNQPQCQSCSVIYPWLKTALCGGCRDEPTSSVKGLNEITETILSRASEHQSTASQHRLNQPPSLNAGLQAANAAQLKAKIATLKKQVKGDTITMEATLFYYPKNGTSAKKAQLLPVLKKFFGSDPAKSLLDQTREELKKAWLESPASNVSGMNTLNFEDVLFGINQSTKSVYHFKPTENHMLGTVDAMFTALKADAKISEADSKERKLTLRVYAYEAQSIVDDDVDFGISSVRRSSTHRSTSQASFKPSTKRKAATSISKATEYTSAFRPRKLASAVRPTPQIAYDQYDFTKITITIDAHGNMDETVSLDEKIEISKNWRGFSEGDKSEDGYLSKGATKFAFMGRVAGAPYAIFQCMPGSGVDELSNRTDLIAELKLLVQGQYFAESFARRAQTYDVRIPDIRWNSCNAFVGTVTDAWLDETSSLVFETFLAAPLLDTANLYTERKFSGSTTAGQSIDVVGSAIDAYAHHVLVDSEGTFLLTDLQGTSSPCSV
ncbi:hypothetical protein LshimejAT787_0409970 [Lyophyllum shimeji]|uniref:Alpha-type protein kinase domain-containing protein n=1 Tax=Lyophyllum shimeji TaxID=47721 RepID=A0A9P3UP51_LYOSH|nr:hypothetical protein LshimejAT787_0409970 [Lyophyllum shimeji]